MKAEDVKVDLSELKEFKRKNFEDRLKFIEYWAEYIKAHADAEWTESQAKFINAQFVMARRFEKNYKDYLKNKKDSAQSEVTS